MVQPATDDIAPHLRLRETLGDSCGNKGRDPIVIVGTGLVGMCAQSKELLSSDSAADSGCDSVNPHEWVLCVPLLLREEELVGVLQLRGQDTTSLDSDLGLESLLCKFGAAAAAALVQADELNCTEAAVESGWRAVGLTGFSKDLGKVNLGEFVDSICAELKVLAGAQAVALMQVDADANEMWALEQNGQAGPRMDMGSTKSVEASVARSGDPVLFIPAEHQVPALSAVLGDEMQRAVELGKQCTEGGLVLLGQPASVSQWVASLPATFTPQNGAGSSVVCVCTLRGVGQLHETQFHLVMEVLAFLGTTMLGIESETEGGKICMQLSTLSECVRSLSSLAQVDPAQLLKASLTLLLRLIPTADCAQLNLWDVRKHQMWLLDSREHAKEDGVLGTWLYPTGILEATIKYYKGTTVLGANTIQGQFDPVQDELEDYHTKAIIVVPLRQAGGRSSHPGAVVLRSSADRAHFSPRDVALSECFVGLLSSVLVTSHEQRSHLWGLFGFSL
eukprot:TRINITY_DN6107_c0_g1_i1.p1 TRINITY_DN6107_c0_g1~~TRINITY_DN6107_c0_g1_i1.p1  ORF type:complete len:505 (+),score=86.42 TRINITY_DN6107_c0_g1_i1:373-1887(+)